MRQKLSLMDQKEIDWRYLTHNPLFIFLAEELAYVLGEAGHDCAYTKTHGLLWAIQKSGLHARMLVPEFVRRVTCASVPSPPTYLDHIVDPRG